MVFEQRPIGGDGASCASEMRAPGRRKKGLPTQECACCIQGALRLLGAEDQRKEMRQERWQWGQAEQGCISGQDSR